MRAGPLISILVVLCLAARQVRGQGCPVVFTLIPGPSNFTLSGAVTAPVQVDLESGNPGVVAGFQGELVAQLPGPCPTDAAGLAAAVGAVQLATDALTGPVTMYPTNVTVREQ